MKACRWFIAIIFSVLITACGGGGTASPTPVVPKVSTPVNTAPSANNLKISLDEDTSISGNVNASDADGDALTIQIVTTTANGAFSINNVGEFTYTPNSDYFGSDSAKITISDGVDSVSITLDFTVNDMADNTPPVAKISSSESDIFASSSVEFSAAQSTDPDNDTLSFEWTLVTPSYSQASLSDGKAQTVVIRPDAIGEYTLSLRVTDPLGESDEQTFSFTPSLPAPTPLPSYAPAPPPTANITGKIDAARFLQQASFGPTPETVDELLEMGVDSWFTQQISVKASSWIEERRIIGEETGDVDAREGKNFRWTPMIFNIVALEREDQLRQRIAFALSQLFVVSALAPIGHEENMLTSYWDTLSQHAFGNYRDLLKDVTLHPMMGIYLNMLGNQKADAAKNIRPDENYAREVMQLFTIGLTQLNQDGSVVTDDKGVPVATYSQEVIQQYAAALTGWYHYIPEYDADRRQYNNFGWGICYPMESFEVPMVAYDHIHQKTEKQLLNGYYIPAGSSAEQDVETVVDSLFNHPNLAPFFSQHLIRQLVTSNPSAEYIGRVSAVFNNNGKGIRGDIGSTVKAVLLDPEARAPRDAQDAYFGKVKGPLLNQTHISRLFKLSLLSKETIDLDKWQFGNLKYKPLEGDGNYSNVQEVLASETVFNFFRPDYSPTGELSDAGLVAPEMQIATESSLISEVQIFRFIGTRALYEEFKKDNPTGHYAAYDFTQIDAVWDESGYEGVVEFLNTYLSAGRMSTEYKNILLNLRERPEYAHVFDIQNTGAQRSEEEIRSVDSFLIGLVNIITSTPQFAVQK